MADISFDAANTHNARSAGRSASRGHGAKWSARRTLLFVVAASLLLWTLILAPFFLI